MIRQIIKSLKNYFVCAKYIMPNMTEKQKNKLIEKAKKKISVAKSMSTYIKII